MNFYLQTEVASVVATVQLSEQVSTSSYLVGNQVYPTAIFFFLFWFPRSIWGSQGQGSDPSPSSYYCTAAAATLDPLTHSAWPEIELEAWPCRHTEDPLAPRWELPHCSFVFFISSCYFHSVVFSVEIVSSKS